MIIRAIFLLSFDKKFELIQIFMVWERWNNNLMDFDAKIIQVEPF